MEELRAKGKVKHQIIAVACSIDHAKAIRALYVERNYRADVMHSDLEENEANRVRTELQEGRLDAIVQVQILAEGADYPTLSVAAIFRPYRRLVPYAQFVGRIMRVTSENSPGDTDNRGYVVSHVGLNVDRWWEELKQLDADDQEFFDGLGSNDRSFLLSDSRPAGQFPTDAAARRRFRPDMVVLQETIAHYIQEKFLPEDAKAVIDDVVNAMALSGIDTVSLGVTREDLEERIKATISEGEQKGRVLEQPIQPQRGRQVARQRLDERIRSASKQLLNELKLSVGDSIFRAPFRKLGLRTTLLLASCSSTWKSWNT